MMLSYDEYDDPDAYELAQEAKAERRYYARLAAHPHCDDPDHPGCVHCDESEDDVESDDEEGEDDE